MGENDLIKMLEPQMDESMRSKKTHWPQIVIFLNGIFLTIASTVALFIYMEEIAETSRNETIQSFNTELETTFKHIEQLLKLEVFAQKNTIPSIISLTRVSKNIDENSWTSKTLYGEKNTDKTIVKQLIKSKNYSEILSDKNYFYLTYKVEKHTFFLAKLSPDLIKNILMKSQHKNIEKVKFFDKNNDNLIYSYKRDDNPKAFPTLPTKIDFSTNILNKNLQISMDIKEKNIFFLSDKLPFIILLFGGGLTILGTLFVRNNHRQSHQMHMMNDILSDKNQALEYKIEETENIYRALKESEEEYKAVVNSVQDVLFELDMTGQIVFLNNSWKRVTGFLCEDVYGENLFKLIHHDNIGEIQTAFFKFLKDQKYSKHLTQIQTIDGDYRSINIAFSVLRDGNDGTPHIIGTITDVEEKRRAELALDEAEKRSRKIIENAAGGIYQISPDGKVMSANPSFLRILGHTSLEDMQADDFNIRDFYANPGDLKTYEMHLKRDGYIRNFEIQFRHTNGKIIWINENARVVKDGDKTLYYEGSIEDITQRKEAETALIEAKLNSDLASRAKSEFLANMSHELRTPLNSIIGFSEIIKGEALGEIEQKNYVDYAKDIHNSGTRLLSIINEILGISKIDAGDRQLNESIVDLSYVSKTCVDLMANKIENRHLHINNLIDETIPNIVAEELAFKQMLMNLLSNAIKFTPENGSITLSCEYHGDDLRFSITDTGIGIDEVDIPKALSPFGQVDNTLSRNNIGTGLGLTLVQSLIRLHDGSLELISQKGFGTTVTLTIPSKRVATLKEKKENTDKDNVSKFSDYK